MRRDARSTEGAPEPKASPGDEPQGGWRASAADAPRTGGLRGGRKPGAKQRGSRGEGQAPGRAAPEASGTPSGRRLGCLAPLFPCGGSPAPLPGHLAPRLVLGRGTAGEPRARRRSCFSPVRSPAGTPRTGLLPHPLTTSLAQLEQALQTGPPQLPTTQPCQPYTSLPCGPINKWYPASRTQKLLRGVY